MQINDRAIKMLCHCSLYNFEINRGAHPSDILEHVRAIRRASQGMIRITANLSMILRQTIQETGITEYRSYYGSVNTSLIRRWLIQKGSDLVEVKQMLE